MVNEIKNLLYQVNFTYLGPEHENKVLNTKARHRKAACWWIACQKIQQAIDYIESNYDAAEIESITKRTGRDANYSAFVMIPLDRE